MATDIPPHPRWYVYWRRLMIVTWILLGLSLAYLVPVFLAVRTNGNVATAAGFLSGIGFIGAFVLTIVAAASGLAFNLMFIRRKAAQLAVLPGQIMRPLLIAVLGCAVVFVALALAGPALPLNSLPIITGLSICDFKFQVLAYEDQNGNGLRDANEPGLANINVTVSYPSTEQGNSDPKKQTSSSATTDSNGLALVHVEYIECPTTAVVYGMDTFDVQTPQGYTARTETKIVLNPIELTYPMNYTRTVYVGFTKQ